MRTTLNIDDDLLSIARERARQERKTVGEVVSEAVRDALTRPLPDGDRQTRNGFPQLPRNGRTVTNEMIDNIRDEIGV